MGGHGGLNILPQKRWNVYNFDNREKVRRDEEEASKEEQLKREQSRKRDAEFRLDRLRASRGLAPLQSEDQSHQPEPSHESDPNLPKSGHINLFEGIKILDLEKVEENESDRSKKKAKKEVVVAPEDEKYRFGYSYVGKQVKLPWYLEKPNDDGGDVDDDVETSDKGVKNKSGKKTLEELREERLKRERAEKERERALIQQKRKSDRQAYGSRKFSRARGDYRDKRSGFLEHYVLNT